MTRTKIIKSLADRIAEEVGCFASIADICRITGLSRSYLAPVLAKCEPFGQGNKKKYFCEDIAEALGREL